MIKHFKTTQALAFILNILLTRNTFAQQQVRGISHNDLNRLEVDKSDPFLEATVVSCDSQMTNFFGNQLFVLFIV